MRSTVGRPATANLSVHWRMRTAKENFTMLEKNLSERDYSSRARSRLAIGGNTIHHSQRRVNDLELCQSCRVSTSSDISAVPQFGSDLALVICNRVSDLLSAAVQTTDHSSSISEIEHLGIDVHTIFLQSRNYYIFFEIEECFLILSCPCIYGALKVNN